MKKITKNNIDNNALIPTPNLGRDYMNRKAEQAKIAEFAKTDKKRYKNFKFGVGVGY